MAENPINPDSAAPMKPQPPAYWLGLAAAYESALFLAVIQSVILALLGAVMLDGGGLAAVISIALGGFWAGVITLLVHRPRCPSTLDVLFIKWGMWAMFPLIPFIAAAEHWLGWL